MFDNSELFKMSNTLRYVSECDAKDLKVGDITCKDGDTKLYIGNNDWASIKIPDTTISNSISLDYENIFQEMAKRFNKIPIIQHKCHNCGGTVEMDENKHIFKCPYCKSVYAVGIAQINRGI